MDDQLEEVKKKVDDQLRKEMAKYRFDAGIIDLGEAASRMLKKRAAESESDLPQFGGG